jgi:hypothetical protein
MGTKRIQLKAITAINRDAPRASLDFRPKELIASVFSIREEKILDAPEGTRKMCPGCRRGF